MKDVRKVPVYRKEGDVFVKAEEISEEEAKSYVDEPDVEEVTSIYIIEDDEYLSEEEESRVHAYRIP